MVWVQSICLWNPTHKSLNPAKSTMLTRSWFYWRDSMWKCLGYQCDIHNLLSIECIFVTLPHCGMIVSDLPDQCIGSESGTFCSDRKTLRKFYLKTSITFSTKSYSSYPEEVQEYSQNHTTSPINLPFRFFCFLFCVMSSLDLSLIIKHSCTK